MRSSTEEERVTNRRKNAPPRTTMTKATLSCLAVSAVFAAAGCSIPADEAVGGSGGSHAAGGETSSGGTTVTGGISGSGGMTATGGNGGLDAGNSGADGGAALTQCTPARPHAGGTTTVQMQFGGMNRDYVLHIP